MEQDGYQGRQFAGGEGLEIGEQKREGGIEWNVSCHKPCLPVEWKMRLNVYIQEAGHSPGVSHGQGEQNTR